MTKITIERETLKWAIRWHESRIWPGPDEVSVFDALRAALAAQPAETQGPVAWRHSKTGRLYDSVEEVPLADGDEWAEPLYLAAPPQPAPAAWRQWSTKLHDWDYQTDKGDLRPDTPAEPLFVAAAQPAPAAVPPAELTWLFTHCRAIGMVEGSESGKWEHDIALFTQRQAERIRVLERLVIDAAYTLDKARIWNGMGWTYHPLHPIHYTPMRERLHNECDNIEAIRSASPPQCTAPPSEPQ